MILLYDEPPIAVSPTLAVAWGINDACFMQQVHYWCMVFEKKHDIRHLHNGYWWVYNTNEAWQEQLPWMCIRSVRTMVRRLTNAGVVLMDRWNIKSYDRTAWYTIDVDALQRATVERLREFQVRQDHAAYSLTFIQTVLPLLQETPAGETGQYDHHAKVACWMGQELHDGSGKNCMMDHATFAATIPETNHIWELVLHEMRLSMTRSTYDRWLAGSTLAISDHAATVTCRDAYAREWLTYRLNQVIEPVLRAHTGDPDLHIDYQEET